MSFKATSWALNDAPVDSPVLTVVLLAMAERANDDGSECRQSIATIAAKARVSTRSVQRHIKVLLDQGVIVLGDQTLTGHHRADHRPVVYDLQMHLTRGDILSPRDGVTKTSRGDSGGSHGVTVVTPRGDSSGAHGVTAVSDNKSLVLPTEEQLVRDKSERERAPASGRGSRLPADWQPSPELITQMRSECPGLDVVLENRNFEDWWKSAPGQRGRKADWEATWRVWMRKSYGSRVGTSSARPRPSTTDDRVAAVQALKNSPESARKALA